MKLKQKKILCYTQQSQRISYREMEGRVFVGMMGRPLGMVGIVNKPER